MNRVILGILIIVFSIVGCRPSSSPFRWHRAADIHVHAHGCGAVKHTPASILADMKKFNINIASVLVWGGCGFHGCSRDLDLKHLRGQRDDPISEANHIIRWDVELSKLPNDWHGHLIMLNVAQRNIIEAEKVNYPGKDYHLPNFSHIQSQDGLVGYAHGGDWHPDLFRPGSIGPRELPLDVALERVDFLADEHLSQNFLWLWYSMLSAGFHITPAAGSDNGCLNSDIGLRHTAFALPNGESLTYDGYIEAIRKGRTVVRNNSPQPDFLDLRVNGSPLGSDVIVKASQSAVAVEVDSASVQRGQVLELIVNGTVESSAELSSRKKTYRWSLPIKTSSWIAARTKDAHTAAIFVLKGGCPVRLDPAAARKWRDYLDWYLAEGLKLGMFGNSAEQAKGEIESAKVVWTRIAGEGDGSLEPDCSSP